MRWIPLESNPDVISSYISKLGVTSPFSCVDVFSLDEELLCMVPEPVLAIFLLFPHTKEVNEKPLGTEDPDTDLFFIRQSIRNACGTMAVLHALCNIKVLEFADDSAIKNFLATSASMKPSERAKALETNDQIAAAHEEGARAGQTAAPPPEKEVNEHFIVFLAHNGGLYEMDGRREAPIKHSVLTSDDSFLKEAAVVIRRFMDRNPDNPNFSVMALCAG